MREIAMAIFTVVFIYAFYSNSSTGHSHQISVYNGSKYVDITQWCAS